LLPLLVCITRRKKFEELLLMSDGQMYDFFQSILLPHSLLATYHLLSLSLIKTQTTWQVQQSVGFI
jgi:hypothetical protein